MKHLDVLWNLNNSICVWKGDCLGENETVILKLYA